VNAFQRLDSSDERADRDLLSEVLHDVLGSDLGDASRADEASKRHVNVPGQEHRRLSLGIRGDTDDPDDLLAHRRLDANVLLVPQVRIVCSRDLDEGDVQLDEVGTDVAVRRERRHSWLSRVARLRRLHLDPLNQEGPRIDLEVVREPHALDAKARIAGADAVSDVARDGSGDLGEEIQIAIEGIDSLLDADTGVAAAERRIERDVGIHGKVSLDDFSPECVRWQGIAGE
jgi:hypothetical protein